MMSRAGARAATSRSCLARDPVPTVPSGGPRTRSARVDAVVWSGPPSARSSKHNARTSGPKLSEDMAESSVTVSVDLEEGTVTETR